jgi:hypothetical protein
MINKSLNPNDWSIIVPGFSFGRPTFICDIIFKENKQTVSDFLLI